MAKRPGRRGAIDDADQPTLAFDDDVGMEALRRSLPEDVVREDPWPDEQSALRAEASRPARPFPFRDDLTRRSRGLWLQRPILDLHSALRRRLSGTQWRLDGVRIALAVIREVAVQGTFDEGPTWIELCRIAIRAVREQIPTAPADLVTELAQSVVSALEARDEEDRRFCMSAYDHEAGGVVDVTFTYLGYVRDVNDDLRYRATDQAIFVYGALADHDIQEEIRAILQRIAEEAIAHGDIGRARQISEQQRVMALRIDNNIRRLCIDLKANPEAVTWGGDVGRQVEHARVHLDQRVRDHGRIRFSLKERMLVTEDQEVVDDMAEFLRALEKEDASLTQLQSTLMRSHDLFRAGQAGAFRMRRRSSAIAPLAVAESVLGMSGEALLTAAEAIVPAFLPPDEQRLADLDRLFARLIDNVAGLDREDPEPEAIDEADILIEDGHERSLELEARGQELLGYAVAGRERADLAGIYEIVDALTDDIDERRAVGLACVRAFVEDGAPIGMASAGAEGSFGNDVLSGAHIAFHRSKP